MPDKGMRFRPMLVGEVARVAGVPRETLRVWLRREFFKFSRPEGGWKRFTDLETLVIAIFAALLKSTSDHDLARLGSLLAGKCLMDEWIEDESGVPYYSMDTFTRDRFFLFWRDEKNEWAGDIYDAPDEIQAATNERIRESYSTAPTFTLVNLGTILKQTLLAMTNVEIGMLSGEEEGAA